MSSIIIPPLKLNNLDDCSIEERKKRIDSLLNEIKSVLPLCLKSVNCDTHTHRSQLKPLSVATPLVKQPKDKQIRLRNSKNNFKIATPKPLKAFADKAQQCSEFRFSKNASDSVPPPPLPGLIVNRGTDRPSGLNTPHSKYQIGVVPAYLLRRQKEWKNKAVQDQIQHDHNGLSVLDNEERLRLLCESRDKYEELLSELGRLPVSSDTLRVRRRGAEIEKELTDLESAISEYSKHRVYLKEGNFKPNI